MESLSDGEELVCELDASGNVVAGIVHGASGLLVYGSAGYQFDSQGNSTHLLNDNSYADTHLEREIGSHRERYQEWLTTNIHNISDKNILRYRVLWQASLPECQMGCEANGFILPTRGEENRPLPRREDAEG